MNYYNPYYGFIPTSSLTSMPARQGLFSSLFGKAGGISWGTILQNTQRVLGIANQAIPVVKQITPVVRNAKTMFQVMNEFKKVEVPVQESSAIREEVSRNTPVVDSRPVREESTGPTFFI